jgi:ABC-type polysaccharide/polyol phosphate export permease
MVNLVWGGGLLNRIYIPRTAFAVAAIGTGLVNMFLALIPLVVVMLVTKVPLTIALVFLPVSMLVLAAFALGVGLLISTFAVYFPDVSEMYQIVLSAWMFLTPVMYPESILTGVRGYILKHINPLYYLLRLYRIPVIEGRFPTWPDLWPGLVIAVVALVAGWLFFAKKSDEFSYRI